MSISPGRETKSKDPRGVLLRDAHAVIFRLPKKRIFRSELDSICRQLASSGCVGTSDLKRRIAEVDVPISGVCELCKLCRRGLTRAVTRSLLYRETKENISFFGWLTRIEERMSILNIKRFPAAITLLFSLLPVWLSAGESKSLSLPVGAARPGEVFNVSGTRTFREADGRRGQYKHGFRVLNDSAAEWQDYYGVQFELNLSDNREMELTATIRRARRLPDVEETPICSTIRISGKGWHTITLPWSAFGFEQANTGFLKYVKEFTLAVKTLAGKPADFQVRNVRVVKAPTVSLEAEVRGKSVPQGDTVEYDVVVGNCSSARQSVSLSLVKYGWEEMVSSVEPGSLQLAPGETSNVKLRVKISSRVPSGGHETQVLQAVANGDASQAGQIKFITTSQVASPFILHNSTRWQEVRDKIARYPWAQVRANEIVRQANEWQVPDIADPAKAPDDTYGPYVFATPTESDLMNCGFAYQITTDKQYAEKIALYLRRLSDPVRGYPATLRACNQSLVQEGHYFQHIAMSYDMALPSGVFSDLDKAQIERTFRAFFETLHRTSDYGPINNWNVSEVTGGLYCALALGDLAEAERWFSGPSGVLDQLAKGVMDDGWWNECSVSYNTWVTSEFTQTALALEPFGINFRDTKVSASYSPRVSLAAELSGGATVGATPEERRKPFGMESQVYGPNRKPYRDIRMMWDSLLPFLDYRSVMIGVNDSTESMVGSSRNEIGGSPFELAYYVYRDPAYAAVIRNGGGKRDLLYGVPELPEQTPSRYTDSAFSDNVGLVMLRSQTTNRPVREQIQAALHYGTHGWAHGHFDRTDLLSIMRYGRSFWNPESVFWVYEPFMYKFYCQVSLNHNMVVVDRKMQEASPGERLLFHSGDAMQATVVETETRWSNPPYGGMVYDYVPVKTFAEKCWREGRSVPIPTDAPVYGSLTEFSEPVKQRRAMIVTDDYVVIADWIKGTNAHVFESLYHMKDFRGLEASEKKFLRHDAQWDTNPVGSAQFVTDCDWYEITAPAVSRFQMRFGPGADNEGSRTLGNEDGVLKTDVYSLWPPKQEIMIGTAPELHPVEKRVFYTVRGDGRTLTEGKFGAWILGSADIDVPVDRVKELELATRTELSKKPTLFWANARVVSKDGKEIPLNNFPTKFDDVVQTTAFGKDYFGGPIKIVGNLYTNATPAQPTTNNVQGVVRVDLSGADALRFKATLGGDYPLGDETQRRKVYAIRAPDAKGARFLTVIEPYEDKPMVKSAVAISADALRVELADGRVQEILLKNFDGDGKDLVGEITESKDGKILRRESTGK
jgi:hypothetical protein